MSEEGEVVAGRGRGRGRGGRGKGRTRPRAEEMGEDGAPTVGAVPVPQPVEQSPPPENLEAMLLELLYEGPVIQSQIPSRWKAKHPGVPFTYQVISKIANVFC
jgi:hypothetical protein